MKYSIGLIFIYKNKKHEIFRFDSGYYHVYCRPCERSFVYDESQLDSMINQE
jgi:hypothetical protein